MRKIFTLEQGRPVEIAGDSGPIVFYTDPDDAEKAELISRFNIDEHNLASALDPDEQPRIEIENDHFVVIFKRPKRYSGADNFLFTVSSIGLFLYADRLVIIAPPDMELFEGRTFTKIDSLQLLFLRTISLCIQHFIGHLKVINNIGNDLEHRLASSMENRYLLLMFTIEKSLVYYVNAISANGRVIDRLKANARNASTGGLTPELVEYVDDLSIENAQCLEQAQVYANVFAGLMDARASIVSNNLNVLIKRLTIISVVFMPLNVLAGIGGMSEFSMMTEGIPWPIAYAVFTVALTFIGFVTYLVLRYMEKKAPRT